MALIAAILVLLLSTNNVIAQLTPSSGLPAVPLQWAFKAQEHIRQMMIKARSELCPILKRVDPNKAQHFIAIDLVVAKDGSVLSKKINRTSGYAALDQMTQKIVASASPLPALPAHFAHSTLSWTYGMIYQQNAPKNALSLHCKDFW